MIELMNIDDIAALYRVSRRHARSANPHGSLLPRDAQRDSAAHLIRRTVVDSVTSHDPNTPIATHKLE